MSKSRWLYNRMVLESRVEEEKELNAVFAALADPTRRSILSRLAKGDASVMELAEPFAMSQPAISKHIKVLERAGLVTRGRDAQKRPVHIDARMLAEATSWLENYRKLWEGNFDRLDTLLEEMKAAQPQPDAATKEESNG